MARRDLDEMRVGMRDPAGEERTNRARALAVRAILVSLSITVAWGAILVGLVLLHLFG
jgi:hypothetical protein